VFPFPFPQIEIMNSEKFFERKLREVVARKGGIALKLLSPSFTGLPDRLVLMPGGRVWFVELKSTGKKQSARQKVVSDLLRRLGFIVRVIDNEITLSEFLYEIQSA
jgi:hypothetical protein